MYAVLHRAGKEQGVFALLFCIGAQVLPVCSLWVFAVDSG